MSAGHNLNCLPAHAVEVDLSTDAGQVHERGQQPVPPLADVVADVFGSCDWVVTGSGRGAESIVASLVTPGSRVVANEAYVSAQWWIERFGGTVESFSVVQGDSTGSQRRPGPEPALLLVTAPRARLGSRTGQPVGLSEMRAARAWLDAHTSEAPLVLDASRMVENAAATGTAVAQFIAPADIIVLSAGKDAGCRAGGLVMSRRGPWWPRLRAAADVLEGADGGLSARELESLAHGLKQAVSSSAVADRRIAVESLARRLQGEGFGVSSWGAGSILLDAAHWVPSVPARQFPAQVLLNVIYLLTGIRGIGTPTEEPDAAQVVRLAVRDAAPLLQRSVGMIASVARARTSGLRVTNRGGHAPFQSPVEPVDDVDWPTPALSVRPRGQDPGWLVAGSHAGRGPQRALVEGWGRLSPGARLETDDVVLRELHHLLGRGSPPDAPSATIWAGRLPELGELLARRQRGDLIVVDIGIPSRWPAVAASASGADALWASSDEGGMLAMPATSPLAPPVAAGALFTMGAWLDPWTVQ